MRRGQRPLSISIRFWSADKEAIDSLLVLLRLHSISSFLYTDFSLLYALKEIVDHTCFQKEKPRIPNEPRKTIQQLTKHLSTLDPTTSIESPALGCFK